MVVYDVVEPIVWVYVGMHGAAVVVSPPDTKPWPRVEGVIARIARTVVVSVLSILYCVDD